MYRVYTDGGARGNPGPAAFGFVVYDGDGREIHRHGERIGVATNNTAEYCGLISALRWVVNNVDVCDRITFHTDSDLIARQMLKTYRVKSTHLIPLHKEARELFERLGDARIEHIRRGKNKTADTVVNDVLDDRFSRHETESSPFERDRG